MMNPDQFVKDFGNKHEGLKIQFAQVDLAYSDGKPKLIFDGEDTLTQKKYDHLDTFTPLGGERVMLINGVIVGRIKQY